MALNLVSNFAANVAHRNLARVDMQTTSSLAKLSSGSRVVSAKDDAASLAVGSRLRAEVEALKQANVNAGQASSMLQIADGALSTVSDILVRMKSLAVQSGSGQLGQTERNVLDAEFQALKNEITRISSDTEFNGTQLIAGADLNETSSTSTLQSLGIQSVQFDIALHDVDSQVYRVEFDQAANDLSVIKLDGDGASTQTVTLTAAQVTAIGNLTGTETLDISVGTTGITVTVDRNFSLTTDIKETVTDNLVAANADIDAFASSFAYNNNDGDISVAGAVAGLATLAAAGIDVNGAGYDANTGILRIAVEQAGVADQIDLIGIAGIRFGGLADGADSADTAQAGTITIATTTGNEVLGTLTLDTLTAPGVGAVVGGYIEINIGVAIVSNDFSDLGGDTSFTFKVGSGTASYDDLQFGIAAASATALSVDGNNILSAPASDLASTAVSTAIDSINSQRATIGAAQNRLDFASSNLAASIENAEAARSSLLDLDIAAEISVFTSKQVLLQAGVAMLAQANQLPANLLRLLQ